MITKILKPTKITYDYRYSVNENFNNDDVVKYGNNPNGVYPHTGGTSSIYRNYAEYDLSFLDQHTNFRNANFKFTIQNAVGANPSISKFMVAGITESWNADTLTYNNKPSFNYSGRIELNSGFSNKEYELNVTNIIQNHRNYYGLSFTWDGPHMTDEAQTYGEMIKDNVVLEVKYDLLKPLDPAITSPLSSVAISEDIVFSWIYGTDLLDDAQSKYELEYSLDGGNNWTVISETTSATSYTLPANTFSYDCDIQWKLRVFNKNSIASSWVQSSFHLTGKPHEPVITNADILDTPVFDIIWTATSEVVSYKIQMLDGETVIYDTGEVVGTETSHTVDVTLENNKSYTIKLSLKNQYGYWSDEVIKVITTAFPEPAQPLFILSSDNVRGIVTVDCTKQVGDLETHHFEVFRKEGEEGTYIKIADNIQEQYKDYSIKSAKTYYYYIRAVAEAGQYKDSIIKGKVALIRGSQLCLTSDLSNGINLKYNRSVSTKYNLDRYTTKFDGRQKPVSEYGEHMSKYFNISFLIRNNDDIEKIEEILTANETVLYRDNRGRKIFASVTTLELGDDKKKEYNLHFTLQEVDYNEVV